jgi:hypothetical protein
MGEIIFYIVCIVILGGWMNYKVKKSNREYVSWVEDMQ